MKWDTEDKSVIGKIVLIGVTYFDSKGKVSSRAQYWGKIEAFNMKDGLKVNLRNEGKVHAFPPLQGALRNAESGYYELNTTHEVIKDPDFLYTIASHEKDPS
jgi:hypothetical protein